MNLNKIDCFVRVMLTWHLFETDTFYQVPYTMAKQVSFDIFAGLLYTLLQEVDFDMKWFVSVCAAAAASVLACIFSQPGDMVGSSIVSLIIPVPMVLTATLSRSSLKPTKVEPQVRLDKSLGKFGAVVDHKSSLLVYRPDLFMLAALSRHS